MTTEHQSAINLLQRLIKLTDENKVAWDSGDSGNRSADQVAELLRSSGGVRIYPRDMDGHWPWVLEILGPGGGVAQSYETEVKVDKDGNEELSKLSDLTIQLYERAQNSKVARIADALLAELATPEGAKPMGRSEPPVGNYDPAEEPF